MEIPVSYYTYLNSRNEEIHSFKIKLLSAYNGLEDTQELQEAYPILRYAGALVIFWILVVAIDVLSALYVGIGIAERDWFWVSWFICNVLGITLGLVL